MKQKSIKLNAILNMIMTIMTIIFPLITFPYVSRILGADNIGKVQFGNSVISFIALFAALGMNYYAIREGTPLREDKEKFNKFASQMFSINIFTTIGAYLILGVLLLTVPKLQGYTLLILMQSISMILTTIGVNWLYTIYEDFFYIAVRSILTLLASMILMFVFVKTPEDYYIYALISVIANGGAYIFNFIHSRKYCKFKITFNVEIKKHIKSLMLLFSNELAKLVYINSDVVMLGFLTTDYNVGIYGVSVKVYSIVKTLLNTFISVVMPRLSLYYAKEDKSDYNVLLTKTFNTSICLIFPAITGVLLLSEKIVRLISGQGYMEAASSLRILSVGLLFAVFANFFINAILIINKKEKSVLIATMVAAVENIVLNFILIPWLKQDGAAITTVLAELTVTAIAAYCARGCFKLNKIGKNLITSIIGCMGIVLVYFFMKMFELSNTLSLMLTVGLSVIVYFVLLILMKNEIVLGTLKDIINKIRSKFAKTNA